MITLDTALPVAGRRMLLYAEGIYDPLQWAQDNKGEIEDYLSSHGALLIRGLPINSSELFAEVLTTLFNEKLISYTYRSTPRKEVKNRIYTATEYHPSEEIPQHNENAYAQSWPMRIGFLCLQPAARNGNTPISDSRIAYREIPAAIRDEFERKKVMYVRNYSNIDLPWQEVFQTSSKTEVEQYCKEHNLVFQWLEDDGLRTKQVGRATIVHPVTGDKLWFNQAHLFHVSSLRPDVREDMLSLLGEENLPRNACFGDGTPISEEALTTIREVYNRTRFSFQWERNDLLLLDNMLYTHGRESYEGPRQVLVGMARELNSSTIKLPSDGNN